MFSVKRLLFFSLLILLVGLFFSSTVNKALAVCTTDPSWKLASRTTDQPTSVIYHLKLTNNCAGSNNFNLRVTQLPTSPHNFTGWTWKFANGDLNTAYTKQHVSGTQDVNLTVTKPTGVDVPSGTYSPITVKAALAGNTSVDKTIGLNYQVLGTPIVVTNPPTCNKIPPSIIVTADNGTGNGKPGDQVIFTVSVKNNDQGDSTVCGTPRVNLSATILNNSNNAWRYNFEKESFDTLIPGETKSTKLFVTSPDNAAEGSKTITVTAQRPGGAAQTHNVFYNVVRDSSVTATPTNSDMNCGGIAGKSCPAGYSCQYQNTPPHPDESGICVITSPHPTAIPTNKPTCTPRPACLDSNPPCKIPITQNMCPPTPTSTPIPTTFPGNGLLNVVIGIDGIGKTPRFPLGGNINPVNKNRNLTFSLYDASTNKPTKSWDDWTFTYNPTTQKFENQLALSNDFSTGIYNAYVEGSGFIRARLPGSVTITKDQTTNIISNNFYMITGNINNTDTSENTVDLLDYTVLVSCSIYSQDTSVCDQNPNYATYSDLNGDGRVDEIDLNFFLKEFGNQGTLLP